MGPIFAQAEAAGKIATTASERLFEYGGLGVVVVILFAMVFGGLFLFGYYLIPMMIKKWSAEIEYYQTTAEKQDEKHEKRLNEQDERHERRFKEQAEAFIQALTKRDEAIQRLADLFEKNMTMIRADGREEMSTVLKIVTDKFSNVDTKLDRVLELLRNKADHGRPKGTHSHEDSGGR
jgi:hypothetical protein